MNLKLEKIEIRPCYVNKRKALFHIWSKKEVGTMLADVAIIEYEDGFVTTCYPHEIRFADHKINEYAFTYDFDEKINMKYEAIGYTLSKKPTNKMIFKCLKCNAHMVYVATTSDGRSCFKCKGQIVSVGYAAKGESNELK